MEGGTTIFYRKKIEETISSIPDYCIRVDVLKSIEILNMFKILQTERCESLTRICSEYPSNKERLKVFACEIYDSGSLKFLFDIFDKLGLGCTVNAISTTMYKPIHRPEMPHSKHLQTFYYQLKICIDRNAFGDSGEFLLKLYNDISVSFNRFKNENDRSKAAGRFAVVTWLRIQHCKRDTQLIREVLNGMRERWPKGLDGTLAVIFYNSKMAIAAIMDGEVESAEEYSRIAKHLSASWQDPLTKALICHDSRYTKQRIFEHQRTEEHRKAILDEMITGLCFIESDSYGCELFNRQLKRMFLLYIAQHKLNIHNDLNCSESVHVSVDDVRYASNAIECFKRTLEKNERTLNRNERTLNKNEEIDPRRGMIYKVCKARVCESQGKLPEAVNLLYKATELAEEGAHYQNEARNIREFTDRLILRY
jgi:hypothetical protein